MTEQAPEYGKKDKGNGKDSKDQQSPIQQPINDIEPYLMIGRFKTTGQIALRGQPIDDLIKFKEKKVRDELLDVLKDAMVVVRNLSKQVQKKQSPLLRVARNIILPGGTHG